MPKNKKLCWYCSNFTMEPCNDLGAGWVKCPNCGATEQLNPTNPKRQAEPDSWKDEGGWKHYHPAGVHD